VYLAIVYKMPRNRRNRNGSSRRRAVMGTNSQNAMPVLSLNPSEAFERALGRTNDSCVLRGKFILTTATLTTTPSTILNINPNLFGSRAAGLASSFTRFRIKGLNVRFLTPGSTTAIGFLDDPSGSSGFPTTLSDVLELRSSALYLNGQTMPSNILYSPIDKMKWYSTTQTGDAREYFASTLVAASSGSVGVSAEIDFSIVFAGAGDSGTS